MSLTPYFRRLLDLLEVRAAGGKVPVSLGGTGATTQAGARAALGVPADADVVHLAGPETIAGIKTIAVGGSIRLAHGAAVDEPGAAIVFDSSGPQTYAMEVVGAMRNGVPNDILNIGMNLGPGASSSRATFYVSYEADYDDGDARYFEYNADYLSAGRAFQRRPWIMQINHATGHVYWGFGADELDVFDPVSGDKHLRLTADEFRVPAPLTVLGSVSRRDLVRTIPAAVNGTVELGNFLLPSGAGIFTIWAFVSVSGFTLSKALTFATQYDQTAGAWQELPVFSDSGPSDADDIAFDIQVTGPIVKVRVRRVGGATVGTIRISLWNFSEEDTEWTETSATATVTPPTERLNSPPYVVGGGIARIAAPAVVEGDLTIAGRQTHDLTRAFTAVVGDTVEIGNYSASPSGGGLIRIALVVNSAGFSLASTYEVPLQYAATAGAWQRCVPLRTTGPYGGEDLDIDINIAGTTALLRLRRSGTGGTAGTAMVFVEHHRSGEFAAAAATASGAAAPGVDYAPSAP